MKLERLSPAQRFVFWVCTALLWVLVTGLIPWAQVADVVKICAETRTAVV